MWNVYLTVELAVLGMALIAAFAVSLRTGAWRRKEGSR